MKDGTVPSIFSFPSHLQKTIKKRILIKEHELIVSKVSLWFNLKSINAQYNSCLFLIATIERFIVLLWHFTKECLTITAWFINYLFFILLTFTLINLILQWTILIQISFPRFEKRQGTCDKRHFFNFARHFWGLLKAPFFFIIIIISVDFSSPSKQNRSQFLTVLNSNTFFHERLL